MEIRLDTKQDELNKRVEKHFTFEKCISVFQSSSFLRMEIGDLFNRKDSYLNKPKFSNHKQ